MNIRNLFLKKEETESTSQESRFELGSIVKAPSVDMFGKLNFADLIDYEIIIKNENEFFLRGKDDRNRTIQIFKSSLTILNPELQKK